MNRAGNAIVFLPLPPRFFFLSLSLFYLYLILFIHALGMYKQQIVFITNSCS